MCIYLSANNSNLLAVEMDFPFFCWEGFPKASCAPWSGGGPHNEDPSNLCSCKYHLVLTRAIQVTCIWDRPSGDKLLPRTHLSGKTPRKNRVCEKNPGAWERRKGTAGPDPLPTKEPMTEKTREPRGQRREQPNAAATGGAWQKMRVPRLAELPTEV